SGPTLSLQSIEPDYLSINYVDRFDRIEDYNLGREYNVGVQYAAEAFSSLEDAGLFAANINDGWRFSSTAFLRAGAGISSRYVSDGFENSIARFDVKYYNVLGQKRILGLSLG